MNCSSATFELILIWYLPFDFFVTANVATGSSSLPSLSTISGEDTGLATVGVTGVGLEVEVMVSTELAVGVGAGIKMVIAVLVSDRVGDAVVVEVCVSTRVGDAVVVEVCVSTRVGVAVVVEVCVSTRVGVAVVGNDVVVKVSVAIAVGAVPTGFAHTPPLPVDTPLE